MIRILTVVFGLLLSVVAFGQKEGAYTRLIKEAWSFYEAKNYQESAKKYNEAFSLIDSDTEEMTEKEMTDRYNAACAWTLSNDTDAAFAQLYKIANKGKYAQYSQLINDGDFKLLYGDPRWEEVKQIVSENYEAVKPLSKEDLEAIFDAYEKTYAKVFATGSTVEDVDKLYSFYTDDFEYYHPNYGGIYSREHLYNNTIKSLKKGNYNDNPKRITIKKIIGRNGIAIERQYEGKTKTTMTLFKFRKDKIYYIEEFW